MHLFIKTVVSFERCVPCISCFKVQRICTVYVILYMKFNFCMLHSKNEINVKHFHIQMQLTLFSKTRRQKQIQTLEKIRVEFLHYCILSTLCIARQFLEMVMLYLRPAVSVLQEYLSDSTLQRHHCLGRFISIIGSLQSCFTNMLFILLFHLVDHFFFI